jgi:hypothetical protein
MLFFLLFLILITGGWFAVCVLCLDMHYYFRAELCPLYNMVKATNKRPNVNYLLIIIIYLTYYISYS